jgi:hypothetical protein
MPIRSLVAGLILTLPLISCSGTDTGDAACVAAFRDAQPRAGAPYQAAPLDDAIRRCASLAAWRDAWVRVPDAHPAGSDVEGYLLERCATPGLADTQLCRAVRPAS